MTTTVSDGSTLQDRVIVLTSAEDSAGEVFRFEYVARQVTPPLRDHVHTEQEERLEVLEGTVRCRVAGIDHLLQRGQGMIIPPAPRTRCGTTIREARGRSESSGQR